MHIHVFLLQTSQQSRVLENYLLIAKQSVCRLRKLDVFRFIFREEASQAIMKEVINVCIYYSHYNACNY